MVVLERVGRIGEEEMRWRMVVVERWGVSVRRMSVMLFGEF